MKSYLQNNTHTVFLITLLRFEDYIRKLNAAQLFEYLSLSPAMYSKIHNQELNIRGEAYLKIFSIPPNVVEDNTIYSQQ